MTFNLPNSTPEEVSSKLIVFHRNRDAFITMLDCLELTKDDEFTLDVKKYKEKYAEYQTLNIPSLVAIDPFENE